MKKSKLDSIQNEQDHQTWVLEMARIDSGLRSTVSNTEGVVFVPLTIVELVSIDGIIAGESGTRPKGLRTNIDDPVP